MTPVLVAAAHGTRDAAGIAVVRALLDRVRALAPGVDVRESYVDVLGPSLADVLAGLDAPAVVVPALLSTGYHVAKDLPEAVAGSPVPAVVAAPLGPAPELADLVLRRLREALAAPRTGHAPLPDVPVEAEGLDALVLAAAGSSDPAAARAVEAVAAALSERTGLPVSCAYASAARPTVEEALAALPDRRVGVCTYLLAPGFFADRVAESACLSGAAVVSGPLGADDAIARLLLRRFAAAPAPAA
ncbi:sirohydrochlorin chelatase [Vallicoccus soli]|uniref:Sirohydrochlorin chelatase n=1 Tax=Vallicoccus soli TaxID=2339232 RepID=A0A3A3YYJ3_9ACTN|nr:CbiX/SirB N-terminal domain-containing protein [Vallicoccus soli]RJK96841.1 sirohydrochlorin chelatase [Vallicoccus soli]